MRPDSLQATNCGASPVACPENPLARHPQPPRQGRTSRSVVGQQVHGTRESPVDPTPTQLLEPPAPAQCPREPRQGTVARNASGGGGSPHVYGAARRTARPCSHQCRRPEIDQQRSFGSSRGLLRSRIAASLRCLASRPGPDPIQVQPRSRPQSVPSFLVIRRESSGRRRARVASPFTTRWDSSPGNAQGDSRLVKREFQGIWRSDRRRHRRYPSPPTHSSRLTFVSRIIDPPDGLVTSSRE